VLTSRDPIPLRRKNHCDFDEVILGRSLGFKRFGRFCRSARDWEIVTSASKLFLCHQDHHDKTCSGVKFSRPVHPVLRKVMQIIRFDLSAEWHNRASGFLFTNSQALSDSFLFKASSALKPSPSTDVCKAKTMCCSSLVARVCIDNGLRFVRFLKSLVIKP
jgi:hypothetical protein